MCALGLSVLLGTALLCACPTASSASEFFSAIAGLESLLETEQTLAKDLRIYIDYAKQHIKLLEDELVAIESEHTLALKDTDNYLTNPVNAYRLMKRLHSDWETYEERISHKTIETYFLSRMSYYRENLNFPSKEDVDGSALGLVRLQDTYKLDVRQVAAGILNGVKYGNDMSWKDCFTLGQLLWDKHELNYTKLWFRESIERLTKETYATDPYSLDVIEGVVQNLYQLGDVESAFNYTQRLLQLDPKREHVWRELEKLPVYNTNEKPQEQPPKKPLPYQQSQEFKTYEKVCRGELTQTAAQQRQLRCRYTTNNIPYHYLAPFKLEEHSLMPFVVTYHDMISTHRIDTIKSIAMPLMRRSTVNSKTSAAGDVSQVRVSKNAWLPYDTHPYIQNMLRDVHDATGLDVTFAEQLQVANYGLGGHYEPHFDFFLDTERVSETEGNRIATAIFYFSDVEQGGATAFPHLKFAVKPQKGNVLFWYNLHESGDRDYRTKHAGCPVLMGSKWIANVWIHEMTQTFARPCRRERGHEVSLQYKEVV